MVLEKKMIHRKKNDSQYQCNKELNQGIYIVYTLKPLLITHVYGGGGNIVPVSINFKHLEDFFPCDGDSQVSVCSMDLFPKWWLCQPGNLLLLQWNIAESIPSFPREFYLHHSPHHGLATPEAFWAAISSTFSSQFALSGLMIIIMHHMHWAW